MTLSCCPATTVARSTSRSLASPASRRLTAIARRLSASRAVWRESRKRAFAASARVYVVSTSTSAATRSEEYSSRAARTDAFACPTRAPRVHSAPKTGMSSVTCFCGTAVEYMAASVGLGSARAVSRRASAAALSARARAMRVPEASAACAASARVTGSCALTGKSASATSAPSVATSRRGLRVGSITPIA